MLRILNSFALSLATLTILCGAFGDTVAGQQISTTPVANVPSVTGGVNAIAEYNNLIIIAGSFTQVGGQPRGGLAAFDSSTGALNSWNPGITGTIKALVLSGDSLYVAGPITAVGGQARTQLASFNLLNMSQSNGGLTTWAPVVGNSQQVFFFGDDIECAAIMNNRLYVGGFFGNINGSTRGGVASFDLTNLGVNSGLTSFDPNTGTGSGYTGSGYDIWGVFNLFAHASSNTLIMSGPFAFVGGQHMDDGSMSPNPNIARSGLAAIDGTTGACKTWNPDCGSSGWNDEAMCGRGNILYLGGLGYTIHGGGTTVQRTDFCGLDVTIDTAVANPATSFNPALNERAWAVGVNPAGNLVFASGQWTTVGGVAHGMLLAFHASTGALISGWDPSPSSYPRSIYVTASRVYIGGGFTTIAGQSRQGFAAFDIAASTAAEMDVSRGTTAIADGGTDSVGSAFTAGAGSSLTYTIANTGTASLTLSNPAAITTTSNCAVNITTAPASSVAASGSTTTVLSVTPTAAGTFSFSYSIGNNDSNESPYNWTVSGSAIAPAAPEMNLARGATVVADGSTDSVGTAFTTGVPATLIYTITNAGNATLTLTTPVAAPGSPANCAANITTQPSASVAASGSTSLVVSITASATGAFSCTLTITNNDSNESPYNWTISGSASAAPAPELDVLRSSTVVADGGTDNVGTAFTAGVASPLTYTFSNTGSATLTLSNPAAISALNNCSVSITSTPASSVAASSYASTVLSVTPTSSGTFSFSYSIGNNDTNESPYNWTVSGSAAAALAPEMDILRGTLAIVDGGTDSLSGAVSGSASSLTYSIVNSGSASLSLTTPIAAPGSMVNCTANIVTQPASSVAASGSTALAISVTPGAAGTFSCTLTISNNDGNENPYNWTVTGTATAAPAPELDVLRGTTSITDGGTDSIGSAFAAGTAATLTYVFSNTGSATLTLSNPAGVSAPANCSVSISSAPPASLVASASGSTVLSVTPTSAGAFSFTYSIGNNDANESPYNWTVSGSAAAAPTPEMDVSRGAVAIADGGADTVNGAVAGTGSAITYTISNTGNASLTLTTPVAAPGSLTNCTASIATQPAGSVAAAGSTTLVLSVTPNAAGAFSCALAIANNDSNENPYNVMISGTATAAPAPEMDVTRGVAAVADGGTDSVGNVTNGATQTASYTILNSGSSGLNLIGTPSLVVVTPGLNVTSANVTAQPGSSVAPAGSTTFTVSYTVSGVGAFSFAISLANNDANENPYTWTVFGACINGPEVDVARSAMAITNGGSDTVAGATEGVALSLIYTIRNLGGTDLQLILPVTISNMVNCTVSVIQQPGATVAAASNTTLMLEVTPSSAGTFSFSVSFANNDTDENPYDWNNSGSAAAAASGGNGSGSAPGGGCSTGEGAYGLSMLATLSILLLGARRLRRHV